MASLIFISPVPDPFSIRLVGGSNSNEGQVEVFYNNVWVKACVRQLDTHFATVACRQLGLPHKNAEFFGSNAFGIIGIGSRLQLEVNCTGLENNVNECQYRSRRISHPFYCTYYEHQENAGVRCRKGEQ